MGDTPLVSVSLLWLGDIMSKLLTVLQDRFIEAKTAINKNYKIEAFLDSKGIHTQSNRQICCPFHDDSTPSFSVNFETNEWKCFGCQNGGHFIDIWKLYSNRYENGHYSIYSAVEAILTGSLELQAALGFKSIYKTEEDNVDIFKTSEDEQEYVFDEMLSRKLDIHLVDTDSMRHVIQKLDSASPESIVAFVADCQNGMNEPMLISKYYRQQDNIETQVFKIAETKKMETENLTAAFMEAIE